MLGRRALILSGLLALAGAAHAGEPDSEGRAPRKLTAAITYISVPTLAAPVTDNYTFAGLLVVDAGFDVPDANLRARCVKMQPRLVDAMRTALADYTYTRFRPGGAPDADKIEEILQQATDRTLGQTGARLLLANVMVQKGR